MSSLSIDSIWERIEAFTAPKGQTPEGWCYDLLLAGTVSLAKTKALPVAAPDAYIAYHNPSVLRHLTGPEYDAFCLGLLFKLRNLSRRLGDGKVIASRSSHGQREVSTGPSESSKKVHFGHSCIENRSRSIQ